jgi:aryl sulfotransferase
LFVHYNDMKADLAREMRRVADHLDIELTDLQWRDVVERCTFDGMRKADKDINDFSVGFEGGIEGFLFKGTNGRWRDVLDAADVAAYEAKAAEALPAAGVLWAERGGPAL